MAKKKSTKKPRVSVTAETSTGLNKKFIDNKTKETMTRGEFADRIESGEYEDYHIKHVERNGRKLRIPASNPNGKEGDNLG